MAVGNFSISELHPVPGIRLATVSAGIKKPGRRDVVIFEICEDASVAGVYTRNAFCAAPVQIARRHASAAPPRYFLINTGNANAGTGQAGLEAALDCCRALAEKAGVEVNRVLPFSTGVIGEPLPVNKITAVIPRALAYLDEVGWLDAAHGIMTTDTRPKAVSTQLHVQGRTLTVTGIAKGAGMIKPNMATLLAYVATDAAVDRELLGEMLGLAVEKSFNRITVDGDTSTNDCCMLVATGRGGVAIGPKDAPSLAAFREMLDDVFIELAKETVKDAEGAGKFVTVRVEQGRTSEEALRVAYTVAESPLVKTALFASDPNWGRILAAVGRAGIDGLDIDKVDILLGAEAVVEAGVEAGTVAIVEAGAVAEGYTEERGAAVMAADEIVITVRLGRGDCTERVWTCDLGYEYVKINAEYRT